MRTVLGRGKGVQRILLFWRIAHFTCNVPQREQHTKQQLRVVFIGLRVDGAARLRGWIQNLCPFSRINTIAYHC